MFKKIGKYLKWLNALRASHTGGLSFIGKPLEWNSEEATRNVDSVCKVNSGSKNFFDEKDLIMFWCFDLFTDQF